VINLNIIRCQSTEV